MVFSTATITLVSVLGTWMRNGLEMLITENGHLDMFSDMWSTRYVEK